MARGLSRFTITALTLGFAFLYLPILLLVIYSFNASKLVTVWGGFSLEWYRVAFANTALLESAWVTLRVAALSSTLALILGTMAGIVLTRIARFPGRTLFAGMISAPLVMPEVILGLSLLLLFVSMNAPRGFWTITIAHTTFCMCYVTVVVQSRLVTFDRSLEEAAMDLGATPVKTFFVITLPIIAPALIGGWLLAFTLSLDDLVVASFTTGPGATTLPMRIYSSVRLGVTPEINAVCTVLIGLVTIGVIVASIIQKRSLAKAAS
ncbi:MAG: ABC transporter permease subunit [Geminicoccaceae bacterium]